MLQLKHSLQGKMAAWWSPLPKVGWGREHRLQTESSLWHVDTSNCAASFVAFTH